MDRDAIINYLQLRSRINWALTEMDFVVKTNVRRI